MRDVRRQISPLLLFFNASISFDRAARFDFQSLESSTCASTCASLTLLSSALCDEKCQLANY